MDCAQLNWRCIETKALSFGFYYGVSRADEEKWEQANAFAELGFEPEDDGSLPEWHARYETGERKW
jgi:hypothetical protein